MAYPFEIFSQYKYYNLLISYSVRFFCTWHDEASRPLPVIILPFSWPQSDWHEWLECPVHQDNSILPATSGLADTIQNNYAFLIDVNERGGAEIKWIEMLYRLSLFLSFYLSLYLCFSLSLPPSVPSSPRLPRLVPFISLLDSLLPFVSSFLSSLSCYLILFHPSFLFLWYRSFKTKLVILSSLDTPHHISPIQMSSMTMSWAPGLLVPGTLFSVHSPPWYCHTSSYLHMVKMYEYIYTYREAGEHGAPMFMSQCLHNTKKIDESKVVKTFSAPRGHPDLSIQNMVITQVQECVPLPNNTSFSRTRQILIDMDFCFLFSMFCLLLRSLPLPHLFSLVAAFRARAGRSVLLLELYCTWEWTRPFLNQRAGSGECDRGRVSVPQPSRQERLPTNVQFHGHLRR